MPVDKGSPEATREYWRAQRQKQRDRDREKYNEYMRELRRKAPLGDDLDEQKELNPTDPRNPAQHGTVTRYRRHKCRCGPCKQANAEAMQKYRAKKKAREERGEG